MNSAPKFSKIELLLKHGDSIEKKEFLDCALVMSGDYLVVVLDEKNELQKSHTTTGEIFNMKDVKAYKTHAI